MKISKCLYIALPLICCLLMLAASASDILNAEANLALANARHSAARGDWPMAVRFLTQAQSTVPDNPIVLHDLGLANANLNRPLIAIAWLNACARSDNQYAESHGVTEQLARLNLAVENSIHSILESSESVATMISDDSREATCRIIAERTAGAGFIDHALDLCSRASDILPDPRALCWCSYARYATQIGDSQSLKKAASELGNLDDPQLVADVTGFLYSMDLYDDASAFAASHLRAAQRKAAENPRFNFSLLCLLSYANTSESLDSIRPLLKKLNQEKSGNAGTIREEFGAWQTQFYDAEDSPLSKAILGGNSDQAQRIANSLLDQRTKLRTLQRLCNDACGKNDAVLAQALSVELSKAAASSNFNKKTRNAAIADIALARITRLAIDGQCEKAQYFIANSDQEIQPVLCRQLAFVNTVFAASPSVNSSDASDSSDGSSVVTDQYAAPGTAFCAETDWARLGTIEGLLAKNHIKNAELICENVQHKAMRQSALSMLAAAQIRHGMLSEAEHVLQDKELVEQSAEYATMLCSLAGAYAEAHRVADAARVSQQALSQCSSQPLSSRLCIMDHVWQAQLIAGDSYGAQQTRSSEFRDIWKMQAAEASKNKVCTDLTGIIENFVPEVHTATPVAYTQSSLNAADISAVIGSVAVNLSDEYHKLQLIENGYKNKVPASLVMKRLQGPAFLTAKLILPEVVPASRPANEHLWPLPGIPKQFSLRGYSANYHWGFLHGGVGHAIWLHDNVFELRWSNRLRSTRATITVDGCNFYMTEKGTTMWGPVENVFTGTIAGPRITGTYFGHDAWTSWDGPFECWW